MKWIVEAESIDDIVLGRYAINGTLTECRDCEHNVPHGQICVCELDGGRRNQDSFCSYVERREE
jgi:hypothetical protein